MALRPTVTSPTPVRPASLAPRATVAPAAAEALDAAPSRPALGVLAAYPNVDARSAAASALAAAAEARRQGDLRATLALLQDAVERAPAVETHAALGELYLALGAAGAADPHLRAAADADPLTADRWLALANALALRPDPMAAAKALDRARAAEPGLRVTRDAGGWLTRDRTRTGP